MSALGCGPLLLVDFFKGNQQMGNKQEVYKAVWRRKNCWLNYKMISQTAIAYSSDLNPHKCGPKLHLCADCIVNPAFILGAAPAFCTHALLVSPLSSMYFELC